MLLVREGNGKWTGETEEQILRAEIILSMTKKIKGESKILKEAEERKGRYRNGRTAESRTV